MKRKSRQLARRAKAERVRQWWLRVARRSELQRANKEAKWMEMDHGKICQKAKQKGFKRIIEINENNMGEIISINHECEVE